jgi:5-methylthioadenosine/S-adenosylhomocysteine deaminase
MHPSTLIPPNLSLAARPLSSLIQTGISPHAPYTISEAALRHIKKISLSKKVHLCMHVAESKDEIRLLRGKKSGFDKLYHAAGWETSWAPSADSPFEFLQRLGLLDLNFLAVHCIQVTDKDINLIKKSGVPVAHCPRSNKETGVGKMPLKKFLDAGVVVGLGTDSLASSLSLNLWDEMRYAYRIHRSSGITARDVVMLATNGGAKALGLLNVIGSIEPGKRADIIVVPLPEKDTGDIYSDLLRESNSCIMSVVDGKILHQEQGAAPESRR